MDESVFDFITETTFNSYEKKLDSYIGKETKKKEDSNNKKPLRDSISFDSKRDKTKRKINR